MIDRYSRKEAAAIWSDDEKYKLWLEIETLALEALVKIGKAPSSALNAVREKGSFSVGRINELEATLKHDVIAFLTNVAEHVGEEARFLHWGMTSSDLLDTAFSVQLCRATDLILNGLSAVKAVLKTRANEFKLTPCVGRSHGIHAEPTSFGLKLAGFYAELARDEQRLIQARSSIAVGALSGPVGTFAALPPSVESFVCEKLGLKPDPVSTQVISRDRHAELFLTCAILASTIERMAVEVRHLQRTEVREAEEFFSKGQKGSSAMPHKRNPILSENVTGLARLIRAWAGSSLENVALWHERDISHSSVERVIAPDIMVTLDFMLHRTKQIFENLAVYPERMRENLESTGGLVYSGMLLVELAERGMSREQAYAIVQKHAHAAWDESSGGGFQERMMTDDEVGKFISRDEIKKIFSVDRYLAHVDEIFQRVFA